MSIRRRLLVTLLLALVFIGLAAGAATFLSARRQANELFDYQLEQIALSLRDRSFQIQGDLPPDFKYEFIVQVWDNEGARIYLSRPALSLPPSVGGFSEMSAEGEEWRVFTFDDGSR